MQHHTLTWCRTHSESMQSVDEMMLELRDLLSEMSGKGMTIALHPTSEVVEEEVFDDMVRNLFRDDHKGVDDNDMEQEYLHNASSTPVFEGCTFSILRASLKLLNIQTVYGWSNASLDELLK